jgi:glycosyltransferase involved in cell wall biosynthesis
MTRVYSPPFVHSPPTREPLKIAVLIDHRPNHPGEVGGLAGTWEHISHVACGHPELDLTVFFLGETPHVLPQGENVRHVLLPPLLGTERLAFLRGIPTHTDLAPFHPTLFRRLHGFHVLHATDTFHAFARTALWKARLSHVPLVTSVQTDTIGWARIHTPAILQRLLPSRTLTHWLLEKYHYLDRQERAMERRFGRYLRRCRAVFISHERDRARVQRLAPAAPCFFLGRGLDLAAFHPYQRDRRWLETRFRLPSGCTLLLFVGRLDPVKGVLIAAEVLQGLVKRGRNVHLLVVGDGAQRQQVAARLGDRGTLTGNLPHRELARIYASTDLLIFPSEAEVWPNVVMEARACGLPVLACERGAGHVMRGTGWDGMLLPNRQPETWIATAESLLDRPALLQEMGQRARCAVEQQVPSWTQVLEDNLLPVWRHVAHPR